MTAKSRSAIQKSEMRELTKESTIAISGNDKQRLQNLKQNLKFSGNNKALVALLLDVFENVTAPTMVPMQNKTTTTEFFIGEAELVVELVLQSRCGSCGSPHVMTTICN